MHFPAFSGSTLLDPGRLQRWRSHSSSDSEAIASVEPLVKLLLQAMGIVMEPPMPKGPFEAQTQASQDSTHRTEDR